MFTSYFIKSMLIFSLCCAPIHGVGIDINNPGLTMWQLLNKIYSTTLNTNAILSPLANYVSNSNLPTMSTALDTQCLFCITINTIDDALLHEIDDTTTATLDAVKENGSCIAQLMQTVETNQQDIDARLDELSSDNAKIFSTIESVDNHVLCVCKAVKLGNNMLKAKMDALSGQVAACCEELAADDAALFSAIESLDSDVDNVHIAVTAGTITLGEQINNLSYQVTDAYIELSENDAKIFSVIEDIDADIDNVEAAVIENGIMLQELSENDAKIFSAVERIDTTLGSIFCAARETAVVESPTAPQQVKFIKNKHVNRAGGIVISEPGLYMLTESLTIETGDGILVTQTDNVTIDLNGFTITANAEKTIPFSITQADLVVIKNGTISGGQGIVMNGAYGATLEKLVITYPFNTGIALHDVHGVTIDRCAVREGVQAGITADTGSTQITIRDTAISDCQGNGFDLQAQGLLLANVTAQHNGGTGVTISNSTDAHIQRAIIDSNSNNGIFVDSSVDRIQVESCRVMGNGAIGCVDNGATLATWMNNLASGNQQDDYQNIKAVLIGKATSFWHNVYGK